jgi:hypothetical protein
MLKTTVNPSERRKATLYQAPAALPRDQVGLEVDALAC